MALGYPNTLQEIIKTKQNILLTDGAARGNPGPAGWAYILLSGEKNLAEELAGFSAHDTNNRMEMQGALAGMQAMQKLQLVNPAVLVTDSKFVIEALGKWRHGWKRNDWMKSDGTPVLHQDLWFPLDEIFESQKPKLVHIDAHQGHPGNTRCDLLAVNIAMGKPDKFYSGSLSEYPHFSKIAFETYSAPRYLCWKGKNYKEFETWPKAQEFLQQNPGFRTKKIFSPEEIAGILGN